MIIYEFSTWGAWHSDNGLFSIKEIEVEERPKTYVGKRTRINKNDIDVLYHSFGNRMYRLDKDPMPYIEAMIKQCCNSVKILEKRLADQKAELAKWEALKAGTDNA